MLQELKIQNDFFFATKISTGGGREVGLGQVEQSHRSWGRETIDLNQVHNLRDVDIHLRTIRQAKEEGPNAVRGSDHFLLTTVPADGAGAPGTRHWTSSNSTIRSGSVGRRSVSFPWRRTSESRWW